jgi:hypothetical protein
MLPDDEIKRRIKTPLSDDDVDKYFDGHKTEIMKYSDLENYDSIDELLPKPFDYKIILIEISHANLSFIRFSNLQTLTLYNHTF